MSANKIIVITHTYKASNIKCVYVRVRFADAVIPLRNLRSNHENLLIVSKVLLYMKTKLKNPKKKLSRGIQRKRQH